MPTLNTDKPAAETGQPSPGGSLLRDGRYRNAQPRRAGGLRDTLRIMLRFFTDKSPHAVPDRPIQPLPLSPADLAAAPDNSLWRLGHSSVLLKLDGVFLLTDPVFGQRASPFSFAGPKRFHAPPIALEALPQLDVVIISHDHYDHLDRSTVQALQHKTRLFVTPLGVGDRLQAWGIPAEKIRQLDWWQGLDAGPLHITATPAQHFSGRGLTDGNRTLWASWVIGSSQSRVFFSGDSGYFDGFRQIGLCHGPFHLTLLENGAYNEDWADVHMHPEQTLQAHLDLRGAVLLPIHNGTFDLALHGWTEPLERISTLAAQAGVPLRTPCFGERLDIRQPAETSAWWRRPVLGHVPDQAGPLTAAGCSSLQ
ncbi:MBL fold metallo-hydrolase [Aquitalea denitrificans]|uniref:MBL fold metallo-hydrolase n=1 Tax=Aquitalea denitrificans TaxID=519081 RepID=UPI0013581F31|nr:MBL fold metallo-hydrolase [Aquitalea denitrificans]